MSGNIENGREYLLHVMECLKKRLAETDAAILEGEKEIEDMHEYYWENYTEMDEYGYENFDNQQALFRLRFLEEWIFSMTEMTSRSFFI